MGVSQLRAELSATMVSTIHVSIALPLLRVLVVDRRPGEVILRDRNRAVCLWLVLILAIISCK